MTGTPLEFERDVKVRGNGNPKTQVKQKSNAEKDWILSKAAEFWSRATSRKKGCLDCSDQDFFKRRTRNHAIQSLVKSYSLSFGYARN